VFSDTLLHLERAHLLRLLAWGALSVLLGTLLFALGQLGRRRSPLLLHFGLQHGAWGAVVLAIAGLGWRGLALRDVAGATRLDRIVWLNVGLDAGAVAVGLTLALLGWMLGRRLALVGAGMGVIVQGLGLAVLHLHFAGAIARWM
jgi:hypothetical protein